MPRRTMLQKPKTRVDELALRRGQRREGEISAVDQPVAIEQHQAFVGHGSSVAAGPADFEDRRAGVSRRSAARSSAGRTGRARRSGTRATGRPGARRRPTLARRTADRSGSRRVPGRARRARPPRRAVRHALGIRSARGAGDGPRGLRRGVLPPMASPAVSADDADGPAAAADAAGARPRADASGWCRRRVDRGATSRRTDRDRRGGRRVALPNENDGIVATSRPARPSVVSPTASGRLSASRDGPEDRHEAAPAARTGGGRRRAASACSRVGRDGVGIARVAARECEEVGVEIGALAAGGDERLGGGRARWPAASDRRARRQGWGRARHGRTR